MSDYQDADGKPISLEALCRSEPEWAASRIRHMRTELAHWAEKWRAAGLESSDRFIALSEARRLLNNLVATADTPSGEGWGFVVDGARAWLDRSPKGIAMGVMDSERGA
jgi:hypothetical protein